MKRKIYLLVVLLFALMIMQKNVLAQNQTGFIENKGQIVNQNYEPNNNVKFLLCNGNMNIQLRNQGFSYDIFKNEITEKEKFSSKKQKKNNDKRYYHRIDFDFVNVNFSAKYMSYDPSLYTLNYFTAGTPQEGIIGVQHFQKLVYKNMYNKVDVEYLKDEDNRFKYNFILHSGANINDIRFNIKGATELETTESSIIIKNTINNITEQIPYSYYEIGNNKKEIKIQFKKNEDGSFGFVSTDVIPENATIIIDPSPNLMWGTYLGGEAFDQGAGITTDVNNYIYSIGNTASLTNVATAGVYQSTIGGFHDIIMAKLHNNGTMQWTTYYGGSNDDYGYSIKTDTYGNIIMCGSTMSTTNIATAGTQQTALAGGIDGCIARFDGNGARLWSSYYGGTGDDWLYDVVVDMYNASIYYLAGTTQSSSGIATAGAYQTSLSGGQDAFLAQFFTNGFRGVATYFGGTGDEYGTSVTVLNNANPIVYLGGYTSSNAGIASAGTHQTSFGGGGFDGFIMKINIIVPAHSFSYAWSTYYGGTGAEELDAIKLDSQGNIYITGGTTSSTGISTAGSYQPARSGSGDGFIVKFNPSGVRQWGTYYGGTSTDEITAIGFDVSDNIYLAGFTMSSNNIASLNSYQPTSSVAPDGFIGRISNDGTTRIWGSYYGGDGTDGIYGLSVNTNAKLVIIGESSSSTTMTTAGAYHPNYSGNTDVLIAKFEYGCLPIAITTEENNSTTCYSGINGSARVSATGGTGALTYTWGTSPVQYGTTATGLAAGNYYVTITDGIGCQQTSAVITINQPSAISASATATNPLCSSGTGSITVTASGGTNTLTYSKDGTNFQTSNVFSGLTANTYTITVKDENNCIKTTTATVTSPNVISANAVGTNPLCSSGTGSITVTASGGTGTLTYSKDGTNFQTSNVFLGLTANTYTITVKDANNCTKTTTATIAIPSAISASASASNALCFGGATGSITVTASGGTGTLTYSKDGTNFQTSNIFNGLLAGSYIITIKDNNDCSTTTSLLVGQPASAILATISNSTNVLCYGNSTGSASVTASGGTGVLNYIWNTSPQQSGTTATALSAGIYIVTVSDQNSCVNTASVTITEPTAALFAYISNGTNVSCYGGNNGNATVTAIGGTSPYFYKWNTSPQQTNNTAVNLTAATYIVTVTDNNNCTFNSQVTINPATIINVNTSTNDATCGNANGTATVTATGGQGVLNYNWSTNENTSTITGLVASTYTVTVTDENLCEIVKTVTISNLDAPTIVVGTVNNVLCYGGNSGNATISASGGTGLLTYTWSTNPPQSGLTANNLTEGTYSVTVKDAMNCLAIEAITINQPSAINVGMITKNNPTCLDSINGNITITATGGTGTLNYLWNTTPQQNIATAVSLAEGNYSVTISDENSCQIDTIISLIDPIGITATLDTTINVLCFGGNNGSTSIFATGGTGVLSYLWSTSPQQITATANNLVAGNYSVTIKDANNCFTTFATTITQPTSALFAYISNGNNVSCAGLNDGSATITAIGGTSPYVFTWNTSPIQSDDVAINLSSGTYTVTTTDAHNCKYTSLVTINPATIINVNISGNDGICGFANGSATVTASGGAGSLTYSWNTIPAQTTASIDSLSVGVYVVTVTDANQCDTIVSITIQNSGSFNAIVSTHTKPLCYGNNTGSATASVVNGTGSYDYIWNTNPVQNTATANNLLAGTYIVTVEDINHCIDTALVTITDPAQLIVNIESVTNVACYGNSTGSATVNANGGTGTLSYLWNTVPVQNTATANNLLAGTYIVTVEDINHCTDTALATITDPAQLIVNLESVTNVACYGDSTGSATVNANGGTGTLSYLWNTNPAQNTVEANSLFAGNYIVSVTDDNNCLTTVNVPITQPTQLNIATGVITNVLCSSDSTGYLEIITTGGIGNYNYVWNNLAFQDTSVLNNLPAGNYTVTVKDENLCNAVLSIPITEPSPIVLSVSSLNKPCFNNNNGSITITANGGTGLLSYLWNTLPSQTTQTASGLSANNYSIEITDENNCSIDTSIILNEFSPIISILTGTDATCYNGDDGSALVSIVSGGTAPFSYLWSFNNQTDSVVTNLTAGTHQVTITDIYNCKDTISVTINNPSEIQIQASLTDASCAGISDGKINLVIQGGVAPYNFNWSNSESTQNIENLIQGSYSVYVTDFNKCIVNDEFIIGSVLEECLDIPTAFSPNADNINDEWVIKNISLYKENTVEIYNRWGNLLFKEKNYQNHWNGLYNGNELPTGAYLYIINLNNGKEALTGTITIIR